MWIVCFYIGPGLSEIRHQTPDGQEDGKPVKKDRSTLPIISISMLLASTKGCTMYIGSPQSSSVPVPVPVARPPSPQSCPPVPRMACKKKLLPKMDSDKTTGTCGLSGSSQCPAVLIRGLRSHPHHPQSGGTQTAKRRSKPAKKLLDLLDWPDSTFLGEWERVGAAPPFAFPFFHPGPIQASPVQPFRFVGHLRSARWAPACPITIRCLGLAPQAEQIAVG